MVSVLASSVVDRGFDPRSGQTKDLNIGIVSHLVLCNTSDNVCLDLQFSE
jgi:hypothetical protein